MATIRDVARQAGVSIATVSRVLNGSPRVSDGTRRAVWDAARELDFWPNGAARSLTTNLTNVLGVLLPDLYGEFYSEIIRGIDHAAREARYQVLISCSHANTEELMTAALSMRGRIDGLMVMAPDHGSAEAIDRLQTRFPLVLLNPQPGTATCSAFSIANYEGAFAMTDYLLRSGHRSIAFITGPADNADAMGRLRGYRQALEDAEIEPDPQWEINGNFSERSGYEAGARLLRFRERPTAVFAANDAMAIGLMSALHEAGIAVPGEISVAGFDDITIARYCSPPLTTVHVDTYQLGKRAVEQLVSELGSTDALPRRHEVLPTNVVVRRSCAMADASPVARRASARPRRNEHEMSTRNKANA